MSCSCHGTCGCKNCACGPQSSLFAVLASPTRLAVLEALRGEPLNVTQLQQTTGEEQSGLSHALAQLSAAGLVEGRRDGKHRIYTLNKDVYAPLMEIAEKHATSHPALEKPCICGEQE